LGYPRASVVHAEHHPIGCAVNLDVDRSPGRCVLDGVVHEIGHQDAQRFSVPGDVAFVDMFEAQIDPVRLRGRRGIRHGEPRDVGQGDWLKPGTRGGTGLLAGQHEQLLHQVRRTLDAGGQPPDRHLARRIVGGTLEALRLQLQRGERRAQFMGGIGDKALLGFEGLTHPLEQQVQLLHQWTDLIRQAGLAHLGQAIGLRSATWRRTRETGANDALTTHHTTSIRRGAITAIGQTVRSASVLAICRRTAMACATWMICECDCIENTRYIVPCA
jgi:hypothetical protein